VLLCTSPTTTDPEACRRGLRDNSAPLSAGWLVVTNATVLAMVIDLDRHTRGIYSVNQQPMIELRDSLLALMT